jgi:hypothetical protein
MDIDHIFIFTDDKGKVANQLVAFGLTEGGSRVHDGQGTTNRTFVFDNFYLEIVWVHNEQEIKSDNVLPTGLLSRANFKSNLTSPFGLCIDNTDETEELFIGAFKYQPDYFPKGMTIDILNNNSNLCFPLTVRLPFKRDQQKQLKPSNHNNGIKSLTKAEFQFKAVNNKSYLDYFKSEATIQFLQSDDIWLTLTFDNGNQGLTKKFDELKLTIIY